MVSCVDLHLDQITWFCVWFVFKMITPQTPKFREKNGEVHKSTSSLQGFHMGNPLWHIHFFPKDLEFFVMMCLLPGAKRSASKKLGPWCQQGPDGWMENYQVFVCPEVRYHKTKRHTPPHIFPVHVKYVEYTHTHT